MKREIIIQKQSLRFKRWARVRYASFCSLGRQVSIGSLRADMCDKSLQKQFAIILGEQFRVFSEESCLLHQEASDCLLSFGESQTVVFIQKELMADVSLAEANPAIFI